MTARFGSWPKSVDVNLPGFAGGKARIPQCDTAEQFAAWREGGDSMACRHQNRIYVKTSKSLNESSEFSLDYDCLPLEEANERIAKMELDVTVRISNY